jgi:enamine deaminase RidA (YjgF/YER057c/UK114 family)
MKTATATLAIIAAAMLGTAAAAQPIERIYGANAASPIASAVTVPPGYTTYYISGALPTAVTPAADGKPAIYGDTTQQTRSVLDSLKATLAKLGLSFGDVVKATVILDPAADFAAMNAVWGSEFGTPAQPNKPARAAFRANALVAPGAFVEIEFVAAKKN